MGVIRRLVPESQQPDTRCQDVRYLGVEKKANHLLCGHTNGLDAELAAAEVVEIFQVRTQEVNDKSFMEALLPKMVDLGDTDCVAARGRGAHEHFSGCEKRKNSEGTYRCCSGFGMIDIHPVVEELQTSEVPVGPWKVNF